MRVSMSQKAKSVPARRSRPSRLVAAAVEALETRRLLSAVVFVDPAAVGANNGTTWADAYANLQSALSAAVTGQTIELSKGTYFPTTGSNRSADFQLIDGVTIEGGFAGLGTVNPNAQDAALYPSILSGDIGTSGNDSDNSYHVVRGDGVNDTAVLEGVTITGGNADATSGDGNNGGGFFSDSGSATISDCKFTENFGYYGGAVYTTALSASDPSPTFTDCVFTDNSAGYPDLPVGGGGAIFNDETSPAITNCVFNENESTTLGGAIEDANAAPAIDNCTFTNNTDTDGAALVDEFGFGSTITNCIFWGDNGESEIADFGATTRVTFSDVDGGVAGTGNLNTNPLFINAADNILVLQPQSPCINVGNNADVPAGVTTDLAGNPRIAGGTVDMGAYESQGSAEGLFVQQAPTTISAGSNADIVIAFEQDGQVDNNFDSDVTLSIASGPTGGTIGGTLTVLADSGVATFNSLTFDTAGVYVLTATSGQYTVNLPLAVTSGAPAGVTLSSLPDSIAAGATIPEVTATVVDAFGNPASGSVTISVASGPSGGKITGTTKITAKNGVAVFKNLSLRTVGVYTLQAAVGSVSVHSSDIAVEAGAADKITFTEQPSSVTAGEAIAATFVVEVTDKFGNPIRNSSADVMLSLKSGPKDAIFGGTTSVALNANGIATFDNLDVPKAGSYSLSASFPGVHSGNSSTFKVEPATPFALSIASQPTSGKAGSAAKPALVVDIFDTYGNLVTTSHTFTVSIFSGPGVLSGTISVTTTDGVAKFSKLILSAAGSYVLSISGGGLADVHTAPITVS
jgi:hypothetical protein